MVWLADDAENVTVVTHALAAVSDTVTAADGPAVESPATGDRAAAQARRQRRHPRPADGLHE